MGSLATVKLSGLSGGTASVSEKIALTPIHWQFERPSYYLIFDDNVQSEYSGDLWLNATLFVRHYNHDSIYDFQPTLDLRLTIVAFVTTGFVDSINVSYYDSFSPSLIWTDSVQFSGDLTKTDLADRISGWAKGFVSFQGVGHPQTVYLDVRPLWLLESPNNQTQQLTVDVEVTYFNGTVYKKITQPFEVRLVSDDDNSFEKAAELQLNQTLVDCLGGDDKQDFFRFYLEPNDIVTVIMRPPVGQDFDLCFYGSDYNTPLRCSMTRGDATESIDYIPYTSGWYFIEVERNGGDGIYLLNATVVQR